MFDCLGRGNLAFLFLFKSCEIDRSQGDFHKHPYKRFCFVIFFIFTHRELSSTVENKESLKSRLPGL